MPHAPVQPGWNHADTPFSPPECIDWHSPRLGNSRRVWIFTTGDENPAERPLAVLLDGQFWAESMPVWSPLAALTQEGQLPPAVYLLIDVIDTAHRSRELPCNADFWLAVQEELLPQIQALTPFSARADRTVVARAKFLAVCLHSMPRLTGRSGLAACSASRGRTGGRIAARIRTGNLSNNSKQVKNRRRALRIVLEAGRREPLIFRAIRLFTPNYSIRSTQFSGVRSTADMMPFAGEAG
ncbi:enterobactin/ferric enterobactin esterase [Lelliottia amnigena]|nr:enterobactin/ferric enterobactin esterase [Lelliottia amnigena]